MIAQSPGTQSVLFRADVSAEEFLRNADPLRAAFRFELPAGPNWFSAGMYALHGYGDAQLAGVVASPRLLMIHALPAYRAAFGKAWHRLLGGAGPVTLRYQVAGADGVTRPVQLHAGLETRPNGTVSVFGFLERDTARAAIIRNPRRSGKPAGDLRMG